MSKKILISVIGTVLLLSTAYVFAWTGATEDPPGGTYTPPLVVGPDLVVADSSTNPSVWINKTAAGNLMELQIGGAVKFVIMNSGNVGIGTSAPGGLLGLKDADTYIDVDGSNNMTFTDANAGTVTLSDLAAGGGGGGGSATFDAVVDAGGSGDYTSVEDALAGGAKNIFVKRGTYTEDQWNITAGGVRIVGEERGAVLVTFTNATAGLYISANNTYVENMQLGGTADAIVKIDSGKHNNVFNNCVFEQGVNYLLYANNSSVRVYNCKFDGTSMMSSWPELIRGLYGDSLIVGSEIICKPANDLITCLDDMGGFFGGNNIEGNKIMVNTDYSAHFSGNRFRVRNIYLTGNGTFNGNSFWNKDDPNSTPFLTMESGHLRFVDNYVRLTYGARELLFTRAVFSVVSGNVFDGGNSVEMNAEGIRFSDNTWMSTSVTQTMYATLSSGCNHCMVSDNIIVGKTNTPQVIDNGSNNTKVNNILYFR
jgi:hypothetical protein